MLTKNKYFLGPDYVRIYKDILLLIHPEKQKDCEKILSKNKLSATDVIKINNIIFPPHCKITSSINQKHRCYDQSAILELLDYQKNHHLNNSQMSKKFNISRNTLAKWKKKYLI